MAASLLQKERSLPVSYQQQNDDQSSSSSSVAAAAAGMRRRLSSMSLQIHPSSISDTTSAATAWAMRRCKSVSSIRNWWDWGWGWIISRKTTVFAQDLEFNQLHKTSSSSSSNEGNNCSWKHVFLKLRKIVRSDNVGLPQTVRYTPSSTKF